MHLSQRPRCRQCMSRRVDLPLEGLSPSIGKLAMSERACQSVGIDLGTTYSSLAYMDSQMTPRVVSDSSGQTVVPSVLFFDDQEIIVGDIALQHAKLRADRVVQFVKVHMGDDWKRDIGGRIHTPESLSALILAHMVREAEPQIGEIPSAVITVPAFFTEKRRRATEQAGAIAGLDVLATLNEPMAAAIAYGLNKDNKEHTALVYDLGGGTFDVTVVRISPTELEELATCGNRQLGGKDWDQCLIDHVLHQFEREHKADPRQDLQAIQDLQIACERAKRQVSKMARTSVRFSALGRESNVTISREDFADMTAHLVQLTRLTTEMVLSDVGLTWKDISKVILVGGSTQMPTVRQMLRSVSGREPDIGVNPVLAVALGAAAYAHMLETGRAPKAILRKKSVADVEERPPEEAPVAIDTPAIPPDHSPVLPPNIRFVTAHGVGIRTRQPDGQRVNHVLISKHQRVPASATGRFRTRGANPGSARRIRIEVTQGDTTDIELAELLGIGSIEGLPVGEAEGQPVEVNLSFDSQGRLHLYAVYVNTGQALRMTLDIPGGLKEEEVQQYRRYMEETGMIRKADIVRALEEVEILEDDEDIPILEPFE